MNYEEEINRLKQDINSLRAGGIGWERFPPLASLSKYPKLVLVNDPDWIGTPYVPLTSTSWDGDSFSTTAKTLIDLSAVFGVPAGVKAILVTIQARDSDSLNSASNFRISPNNTALQAPIVANVRGNPNDIYEIESGICPCDANGDIYYQTVASGAGTLDCIIEIWGYWLP